jgi:hypothetical protein
MRTSLQDRTSIGSADQVEPSSGSRDRRHAAVVVGSRVSVHTADGVFTGRVMSVVGDLLRLKWGAGMWDIDLTDVIAVKVLNAKPYVPTPATDDQMRRQAARILGRWA